MCTYLRIPPLARQAHADKVLALAGSPATPPKLACLGLLTVALTVAKYGMVQSRIISQVISI